MSDATQKDIDNIIELLDSMMDSGTSRIKVQSSEAQQAETVKKQYHYGRCDVGSPWSSAKMKNIDC